MHCGRVDREIKRVMKKFLSGLGLVAPLLAANNALAAQPRPWEWRFQPPATPIMHQIEWFNAYTLWFIVPIVLLVLGLLLYCIVRFRESRNPTPSPTSHNSLIEVIWTISPVIVLLFIAVPSFQLLTAQYTPPEKPAMTIKATGVQWYWDYDYPQDGLERAGAAGNDQEEAKPISFSSLIVQDDDERAKLGKEDLSKYPRLLTVDNEMVVPVDTTIRLQVTGADVIHSFAMPAFGIKVDAVPGRLQETWFKAQKEGIYFGQCSELCGQGHAFMPIAIRVVSKDQYQAWAKAAADDVSKANKALMASIRQNEKSEKQLASVD